MGDEALPESVFQKLRGKTKPPRAKADQERPRVFNQNVSRIKYTARNLSTRLGFKETLQGDGNDFSHPPLSNDYLSFSHQFDIVSGVPVFIFESTSERKTTDEEDTSIELPPSLSMVPASSRHGKTQSLEISPGIDLLTAPSSKHKFKSAAQAVALATRLSKPPLPKKAPQGSTTLSSPGLRAFAFKGLNRSASLPASKQVDVMPAEALSRMFFTSDDHPSPILCSVFDPSGAKLATGHGNGDVKIWDAMDGSLKEVLTDAHDSAVAGCSFLATNKLATCDIAGTLVIWDLNYNVAVRATPKIMSLANNDSNVAATLWYPEFSEDGEYMAMRPLHEHCDLYHKLSEILKGIDLMPVLPRDMAVSIKVWEMEEMSSKTFPMQFTYKAEGIWDHDLQIRSIEFQRHESKVCLMACIQDEYRDYHGFTNVETAVLVWPCIRKSKHVVVLDGMLATSSPNLKLVATWNPKAKWGNARGACFLWDMQHYVNPEQMSKEHIVGRQGSTPDSFILRDAASDVIYWCAFADNERLVASIGRETIKILVWDVNLASKLYVLETGIEPTPHVCSIDRNGAWLTMFTLSTGQGLMWDLHGGIQLMNVDNSSNAFDCTVWKSFFSPSGRRLATMCLSRVLVWNPSILKKADGTSYLVRKEPNRNAQMRHCRLSLDGSVVGVEIYIHESRLSLLDVWNVRRGTLVTLPHERMVGSTELFHGIVAFNLSQDGRRVVTWGVDIRAIIWNTHGDGISVVSRFDGPRDAVVMDCSFIGNCSGSTDAVATCLKDGTLLFWKQGHATESIGAGDVASCQFNAIGSRLVLMMKDMRTVVVWDLNTRRVLRSTKFSIDLRQLNKPAISKGWPMSMSPDGRTAVVGLEKDTLRPVMCYPESTMDELRSRVELVANSTVFSRHGDIVVMADFTTNLQVEDEDDPCIWVMDTAGNGKIRRLRGIGRAVRWLAVSGDGRTVASVSDGSTLTVWAPYGCSRCIPDYHQIVNSPRLKDLSGDQPDADEGPFIRELLEEYGSVLLNYPDCYGLSLFMHAVLNKRVSWLKVMAEWAKVHKVSLGLHRLNNAFSSVPMNALQQAIALRSPRVIDLLLDLILDGHVASQETSRVLGDSLLDLLDVYPSIFFRTISDSRMLRHLGDVLAPETAFRRSALLEDTSDIGHPPEDGVPGFWRRMHSDIMVKNEGVQVKAHARYVPYPDLAQVGSRGMLRQLLLSGAPVQIFGTAPIRGVIQYKWNSFAKRILLENLALYTALLFLFTLFSILRGFHGQYRLKTKTGDNPFTTASSVTLMFTSPLAIWKLGRLLRQFTYYFSDEIYGGWRGTRYWLFSGFRLFEITTLLLVAVVIPVMHFMAVCLRDIQSQIADEEVHGMIAPVSILLWWHMLYYTLPFKHTGPLVLIIQEIVKDMTFFLCLGGTVLAGFTVAFFVLFNDTGPCLDKNGEDDQDDHSQSGQCQTRSVHEAFGSLDRSFVTTFGMMLGEFETEWYYDASQSIVPVILWVVYMMTMTIVLLNLLIAIMGATFQKVIQTEEVHFLRVKARVIDDMETIISWKRHKRLQAQIGKYLHILVPQNLAENSFRMANQLLTGMWQKGFSDMVAQGVESLERKISTMADKQLTLQSAQAAIKDNQRAIRDDIEAIQDQVERLARQISGSNRALPTGGERRC